MAKASNERSLEETSTWAVAVVCFVLVFISILIEHAIHLIGKVRPICLKVIVFLLVLLVKVVDKIPVRL